MEDGLISPVAPPVGAHDFAAIFSSRQSTKATVHLMKTSNDNVKQFSKQDVLNDLAVIGKDGTATFSTTIEQNICSNSCSKLESNAQQIEVPDVQANSLDTNKDCNHQPKNNLDLLAMCIENGMVEYGSRTSLLSERYANGDVNSKSSIYNSYINDNGNSVYSNGSTVGSSVKKKIDWMKRINYRNNGTNVSTEDVDGMSSATDGKLSVINNLRNVEIPGNSGAYFPQHESKSLKECDGLINTAEEEDSSMFKHKHYPQIVGIPKFDGTFGNFDFNGDDLSLKDSNVERLHTLSSIVQENGTNAGIGDLAPPNSSYRIGPGGTLLCVSFNSTK